MDQWTDRGVPSGPQYRKKSGVGVVVARFQVPILSSGHQEILAYAAAHHRLVVVLGIPKSLDKDNPLPYECRAQMVRAYRSNAIILPIVDCHNDETWSTNLDVMIEAVALGEPVTLYGGRDSFLDSYQGKYKGERIPAWHPPHPSGTEIRESIEFRDSPDFRAGIIYGIRYSGRKDVAT